MIGSHYFLHPSKNGFSLLGVIVAATLAGVVTIGLMAILKNLNSAQKSLTQSTDIENLVVLLKMALQDPAACPAALQDAAGSPVALPASLTLAAPSLPASGIAINKIAIGTLLVDTATPFNGLYIDSIKLIQVAVGNPSPATPIPYTATLRITGSKTAPGAQVALGGGVLRKDIPISLRIEKPAVGLATLTSCGTKGAGGAGGTLSNLQRVVLSCTSNNCRVACPAGKVVLTGGCRSADNELSGSYPSSDTTSSANTAGTQLTDGTGGAYSWACYGQGDNINKAFVVCVDE